jgi:hypothetical protein
MPGFEHKLTRDIRVIVGMNQGSPAWWCVELDRKAKELYRKDIARDHVDLSAYGRILKKGWGAWPPGDVVTELKTLYGIKLKDQP